MFKELLIGQRWKAEAEEEPGVCTSKMTDSFAVKGRRMEGRVRSRTELNFLFIYISVFGWHILVYKIHHNAFHLG